MCIRDSPCRLVILIARLPWILLPNSFSMFRRSMVKANAGQKNQHACIQNNNDQLWCIVPLCQNAWWHIGSEAPKIKQHAFMAGQKNQHAFIASQHALQCWGGFAARPPVLKTKESVFICVTRFRVQLSSSALKGMLQTLYKCFYILEPWRACYIAATNFFL